MGLPPRTVEDVRKKCRWLSRQAAKAGRDNNNGTVQAIVFDLDDTLMHYDDKVVPFEPVLALLHACREAAMEVHIVTARHGTRANRQCAKEDLAELGLGDGAYTQLWMRPSHYPDTQVAECKQRQRDAIVAARDPGAKAQRRRIFAAVGDQWWDLYEDDDDMFDRYGDRQAFLFEGRERDGFAYAFKLPSL